ncbi:hypothetical protein E8E14_012465 [Neopestalotiopsis sp. 37M]|nr:hypothetical protein E8E14_012465 [Neopestalotiopsis sp. 37M]
MASSTSNKPDRASLEEVVSRADFELVQSFLRVARLLQPQSTNIDSARTRHISHGSSPVPSTVPNTPPSVPHVDHDYCNNEPMILDEDGVGNDNEGNRKRLSNVGHGKRPPEHRLRASVNNGKGKPCILAKHSLSIINDPTPPLRNAIELS